MVQETAKQIPWDEVQTVRSSEITVDAVAFAVALRTELELAYIELPYDHQFVMQVSRALRRARAELSAIPRSEDVLNAIGLPHLPNDEGWGYRLPGYSNDLPAAE